MRFIARAVRDGHCIFEVGEYGGPPESIKVMQERLCLKVRAWLEEEEGVALNSYFVEQFDVDGKQHWVEREIPVE